MKLIIDILEKEYELVRHGNKSPLTELELMRAVANGTPLPEYYGRLIDTDEYNGQFFRLNDIDNVLTIIEGGDSDEDSD